MSSEYRELLNKEFKRSGSKVKIKKGPKMTPESYLKLLVFYYIIK